MLKLPGDAGTTIGVAVPPMTATLYGATPPETMNPNVCPVQPVPDAVVYDPGVILTVTGGTGGGGPAGPKRLCSVAVVVCPVASTTMMVAGLAQTPVVIAVNDPPNGILTPF
jgi:hypothetical protein